MITKQRLEECGKLSCPNMSDDEMDEILLNQYKLKLIEKICNKEMREIVKLLEVKQ